MHFLIVSRISIPAKDRTLPCWNYLRDLGHTVTVEHPDSVPADQRPDVILSWGVTVQDETFRAMERWPGVPMAHFLWDCYAWIWEPGHEGKKQAYHPVRGKEYDYVKNGELCRRALEVWVPSECTGRRATQWWGIKNWHTILSACPWWDHPNVRDDGYALMCLREIPDPWWGMFEKCCEELGIPYRTTRHEVSYEEYQDAVAGCRFLCAPLYELSTGGLSLMEGYRLGKPVLLSDSEWNGGADYFGSRATYFRYGHVEDFKAALRWMHNETPQPHADQREYIETRFSDRRMVDQILERVQAGVT